MSAFSSAKLLPELKSWVGTRAIKLAFPPARQASCSVTAFPGELLDSRRRASVLAVKELNRANTFRELLFEYASSLPLHIIHHVASHNSVPTSPRSARRSYLLADVPVFASGQNL